MGKQLTLLSPLSLNWQEYDHVYSNAKYLALRLDIEANNLNNVHLRALEVREKLIIDKMRCFIFVSNTLGLRFVRLQHRVRVYRRRPPPPLRLLPRQVQPQRGVHR